MGNGCDYCDGSFESRKAEIDHVLDEHRDEITSHEKDELKRERNQLSDEGNGRDSHEVMKTAGIAVLAVVLFAGIGYALVSTGVVNFNVEEPDPGSPASMGPAGSTHAHGEMEVVINGEPVDLNQDQYTHQDNLAHIHAGEPGIIHKHATGATWGYFFDTINWDVHADEQGSLCFEMDTGDQYCDSDGDLSITMNGQEIASPEELLNRDIQGVQQVQGAAAAGGDDLRIEYSTE